MNKETIATHLGSNCKWSTCKSGIESYYFRMEKLSEKRKFMIISQKLRKTPENVEKPPKLRKTPPSAGSTRKRGGKNGGTAKTH
jgi:hypothetical protein